MSSVHNVLATAKRLVLLLEANLPFGLASWIRLPTALRSNKSSSIVLNFAVLTSACTRAAVASATFLEPTICLIC